MGRKKTIFSLQERELIKKYIYQLATIPQIAKFLGKSVRSVESHIRKQGNMKNYTTKIKEKKNDIQN